MKGPALLPLIVGIPGPCLGKEELRILEENPVAGIILFARNILDGEQTRTLIQQFRVLEPRPFVTVDLEGGMVNRLSAIWGDLPSMAEAAAAGAPAVFALGEAAGAACRFLGIHQDLAPVVDLRFPEALLARQQRCLAEKPEDVARLARSFQEGLGRWCVSGCLKHFPGLGAVTIDTHQELPRLELSAEDMEEHLQVFEALSEEIPVVMVAHVIVPSLGDETHPASLSRSLVQKALNLPGHPVVLSDDIEMGALGGLGDLPELVIAALRAHHHGVLVCNSLERLPEIAASIAAECKEDPSFAHRLEEGIARLGTLGHGLCLHSASVPAPDETTVSQLWERARLLSS